MILLILQIPPIASYHGAGARRIEHIIFTDNFPMPYTYIELVHEQIIK